MAATPDSILSQIRKLKERREKMEYKERRIFEETEGDPPPATVIEYRRIIEVDNANLREFQRKLERFYPVPV
jgi:DNA-directed RNA polymerase alpha subunit